MNEAFLESLTKKMEQWNALLTTLGDVFLEHVGPLIHSSILTVLKGPKFKVPYMKYTGDYAHALNVLKDCERSPTFEAWEQV